MTQIFRIFADNIISV